MTEFNRFRGAGLVPLYAAIYCFYTHFLGRRLSIQLVQAPGSVSVKTFDDLTRAINDRAVVAPQETDCRRATVLVEQPEVNPLERGRVGP